MIRLGKGGSIVNVSSQAALVALRRAHLLRHRRRPRSTTSPASRRWNSGSYGIRVNSVNPTVVMTDNVGLLLGPRRTSGSPSCEPIAVLPFQNMSPEREHEYFADGIVEDIITGLSRIRWIFVTARNSSFTYKGRIVDVGQVGRELGVRYVLEGSVRRSGSRLRITAQLIEAETHVHVWAERYDGAR